MQLHLRGATNQTSTFNVFCSFSHLFFFISAYSQFSPQHLLTGPFRSACLQKMLKIPARLRGNKEVGNWGNCHGHTSPWIQSPLRMQKEVSHFLLQCVNTFHSPHRRAIEPEAVCMTLSEWARERWKKMRKERSGRGKESPKRHLNKSIYFNFTSVPLWPC